MKLITSVRKKPLPILMIIFAILIGFLLFHKYSAPPDAVKMVMGGTFYHQASDFASNTVVKSEDVEKYFRPSDLPVLNDRFNWSFFRTYFQMKLSEITVPDHLLGTPEETIINYFSILREAENADLNKLIGCGSIGNGKTPYPIAYHFLSSEYQKKIPYEKYLETFKNILHISLIKYKEVPVYENPLGVIRYFVEIETIEGSENKIGNFAYYYGFVDLLEEDGLYQISNLEFHGENYLCAPYHGWSYDAEASVEVRYGGWCKLIKVMYPTTKNGYVKHIYFDGTDGNVYMIEFFKLTNDTDIETAQYRKKEGANWELIHFNPEDCVKDKS
jgi:hypothetical protein